MLSYDKLSYSITVLKSILKVVPINLKKKKKKKKKKLHHSSKFSFGVRIVDDLLILLRLTVTGEKFSFGIHSSSHCSVIEH